MTNSASTPLSASDDVDGEIGRPAIWPRVGCLFFVLFALLSPVLLILCVSFAWVQGEEFNPSTFESRRFTYFRVPFINVPFGKFYVDDSSTAVQQNLLSSGFIVPDAAFDRWDLAQDSISPPNASSMDAGITLGFLRMGFLDYWDDWNAEYPNEARDFWPLIAEFCRLDEYLLTVELFEYAIRYEKHGGSAAEESFIEGLHELAARLLVEEAGRNRSRGDQGKSSSLMKLSERYAPAPSLSK